ncbi:MAG: methyltransferase [Candidatus Aenigmatarchaeota archaeon]|nr:MAG: methyltransferase [Candidatus Aenigmarchaeota archaeon]
MQKAYFKGFGLEIFDTVYAPREDTELLLDILDVKRGERVLEIGIGSGVVSIAAAKRGADVTGADINPEAVRCAERNAETNNVRATFLQSDLFANVSGTYDAVLFNAPYLPVAEDPIWSAGENLEVLERFAQGLGKHLRPEGRALVVISSLTGIEKVKKMFEKNGFAVSMAGERKVPGETLYGLRIET